MSRNTFGSAPHTLEECTRALDEMAAYRPELIRDAWFGCAHGDHTCYATVDASSEMETRGMIPSFLAGRAKIQQVEHYTPEQIRAMHQKVA